MPSAYPYRPRLRMITIVYWILLLYIVAALVWWFIALNQQNTEMARLKREAMENSGEPGITIEKEVAEFEKRKKIQYLGEGAIFLLLILVGAVFVYRATRRQLKLSQQQQNFMMAVTHELKTPIAAAQLHVETLLKHTGLAPERQRQLLQKTLGETHRLDDLASNILLASRLESGERMPVSQPVQIDDLVEKVIQSFKSRYPNQPLNLNTQSGAVVQGDSLLLRLAISNLVDNAIKYGGLHVPVLVSTELTPAGVWIRVADQGPGIAEEECALIFEKFYRSGNEATRQTRGTGLGLYLCRQIAKAHRGSVQLSANTPSGAVFSLFIPTHDASKT